MGPKQVAVLLWQKAPTKGELRKWNRECKLYCASESVMALSGTSLKPLTRVSSPHRPDFDDDDDDEGNKLFRYLFQVLFPSQMSCCLDFLSHRDNSRPVFPIRCDDETSGSNNDKERFAR